MDTAELLELGDVNKMMSLSSFYQRLQTPTEQNQTLRQWLIEQSSDRPISSDQPTLLITHQVNITSLTGIYPSEGELVIVKVSESNDLEVIGSIKSN